MPVSTPDRRVVRFALAVAALLVTGAALGGCAPDNRFPPPCPQLALLRDAADLTSFRPGGHDLTDMVTDARITAVPATCMNGPRGTVKAEMRVSMQVTRGPATPGRTTVVPYFVAVTEGDSVLDEQDYQLAANFPTNVDTITLTGAPITLDLPVTTQKSAAAYKIYVGFRLTQDELDYNRRRGPR